MVNRKFTTFAERRQQLKDFFGQDEVTVHEQVINTLASCANWLTTRGQRPYYKSQGELMLEYGFSLSEISTAYNDLLQENEKLRKKIQKLEGK